LFRDRVVDQAADGFDEFAWRLGDDHVGDSGMHHALALRVGHCQPLLQRGVYFFCRYGSLEQIDETFYFIDGARWHEGYLEIAAMFIFHP